MAPGGRRLSESEIREHYPLIGDAGEEAPVVVVPPTHWPMDDAGPNLAEVGGSGGSPFVPVRMYGTAVPTYQVSPLAPGSTHAVTIPPGIMLQAKGFNTPENGGWGTWDFWVAVTPDEGFATLAQLAPYTPGGAALNVTFTPTSINCGMVGLATQTFPRPGNPVHLRWSVLTSGNGVVETVIEINGATVGHYTLPANAWYWGGGPSCSFYSSRPMTVDEVRIYTGAL